MTTVTKDPEGFRWQDSFAAMLPEIQSRLRNEFRDLDFESQEDAIHEGVAHCLFSYVRLHNRGWAHLATAYTLVFYSSLHVRRGRPAVGKMNSKDPLSRYAQQRNDIRVDDRASHWIHELADDKRAPVLDQVAAKLDVTAWFTSLSQRMKQVTSDLAFGCSTKELAGKYGVTAGRISQLRRALERS